MFESVQMGVIIESIVSPPEIDTPGGAPTGGAANQKNFYRLRLVDSGSTVTAVPLQQSRGVATSFAVNDSVMAVYAAGAWLIIGLVPIYASNINTSPRLGFLAPGDAFYGNADTGAGFHVTGGMPSIEAAGFDFSGKNRRSAGTFWVPDSDMINNLCRRFGLDGAPGNVQMFHDDLTGRAAFRIWVRGSALPKFDGRTARIHMGYHRDPVGAVFSVATFPQGPDPTDGIMEVPFKMDPEAEVQEFGGLWPKLERGDWQSRFYVMPDGTSFYESALVAAPSLTPTTAAQVNARIIITPEGFVTTDIKQTKTLSAMNNIIRLKVDYVMIAEASAIIKAPAIAIIGEVVRIGVVEKSLQLVNLVFFDWFANVFMTWVGTHVHISSSPGSPTGPPVPDAPDVESIRATGLTTNTTAS